MRKMRHLDLFSGIGGFALAVRWLGHETVGFCDNDPYAQRLLAKRFPGVPIYDDIRTLKGSGVGPVDLVTGGFPCQPFSIAGNQRGAADDRHLWPEMARVIAECRPRYVLGENVTGIIKMELDTCISDLESIGYTARAIVVPAVSTDARHIRQRVWIMAHDDRHRLINEREGQEGAAPPSLDAIEPLGEQRADPSQRLAGTSIARGRNGGRQCEPSVDERSANAANAYSTGQREQRWAKPGGEFLAASEQHCVWPVEPGMGRVAHGVPGRVDRLRGLGNAIVPQVAYEILREMIGEAA